MNTSDVWANTNDIQNILSSSFCTIFLKENKLKCRTNVFVVLIDVIFVFLVGDLTDSELFFS